MKNLILFLLISLLSISSNNAQTFNFINEVVKYSKQDTIHLRNNYITEFKVEIKYFDEYNFKKWWEPIPHPNIPPIEPFINNFNLAHLRADLIANKNDSLIDFKLLNKRFVPVTVKALKKIREELRKKDKSKFDYTKYLNEAYLNISKPIFNCSKDWAIIVTESFSPYLEVATSGYLNIYRKLDDKWILYHKLELWIN